MEDEGRALLQNAISNSSYGIKAFSSPVTDRAKNDIGLQAAHLAEKNADCIIMGCTELPLALSGTDFQGIPLLDPTKILAESLIKAFDATKLKHNH